MLNNQRQLPKTMCQPVTATGSLLVQVNLIKIVPSAIASEAASIQSSPKLNATSVMAYQTLTTNSQGILAGLLKILFLPSQKVSQPSNWVN